MTTDLPNCYEVVEYQPACSSTQALALPTALKSPEIRGTLKRGYIRVYNDIYGYLGIYRD